jgi:hypothetical protein
MRELGEGSCMTVEHSGDEAYMVYPLDTLTLTVTWLENDGERPVIAVVSVLIFALIAI